jgi:hypothetical protein
MQHKTASFFLIQTSLHVLLSNHFPVMEFACSAKDYR